VRGPVSLTFNEHSEPARAPHAHEPSGDTPQGDSEGDVPSLCVVGLCPVVAKVVARARVFVHEVTRAEELSERRRARSVDHAGFEVEEHRAGNDLTCLLATWGAGFTRPSSSWRGSH